MLPNTLKTSPALLALLASLALAPLALAQDAPTRVAVCNPGRVFQNMDERKVVEDKIKSQRQGAANRAQALQVEMNEMQRQLGDLKPDSAQYKEKQKDLMTKAVEYDVFLKITEAELVRAEKEQIRALYEKIADACKLVAQQRKIDLVLAERKPEISPQDFAKMTPDQLRAALSARDVLHVESARADITEAVTAELNKQFAAPAPAPAGGGAAPAPGR